MYDITGEVGTPEIISDSDNYDAVIILFMQKVKIKTGTVGLPQSQISPINSLTAKGKSGCCIIWKPYLIQGFPDIDSYICAYADAESSINSAVDSFYGTIKFKGKLPVTISNEYKFGDGISN